MPQDILDQASLLAKLPHLLPQSDKSLTDQHNAIACLIHTAMDALSFRLTAASDNGNVLPMEWKKSAPDHSFEYENDQGKPELLIKVVRMGIYTFVLATLLQTDSIASLELVTNKFTSPTFFPYNVDGTDTRPLVGGFKEVDSLMRRLEQEIITPCSLKKACTEDIGRNVASSAHPPPEISSGVPQPRASPSSTAFPRHPPSYAPDNPLEIGRRDLEPVPNTPFSPPPLFQPGQSSDGMLVGPNHPIFGPRNSWEGPWDGDGYLPPMGAPPGARFDPPGPWPRGSRNNTRTSGEPDNDEFKPPGHLDMYM